MANGWALNRRKLLCLLWPSFPLTIRDGHGVIYETVNRYSKRNKVKTLIKQRGLSRGLKISLKLLHDLE